MKVFSLDDIKSTYFDIAAYMTDDNGTFRGTAWFPKLRVNGFAINIGAPDAIVERTFDLVGEDYKVITDNYLAFEKGAVVAPGAFSLVLNPAPIEFASGKKVFRVLRVRAGEVTSLLEDATSTYDADSWRYDVGTTAVIVQTCLAGDIVKVFYPAATAYTTVWADNDVDSEALFADQCSIYLKVGAGSDTQIFRLQSVGMDISFERTDYREIGNKEVVQTGVRSKTVSVTLGRILENFTLEEILRGASIYEYIDARDFSSDISLTVKIYTDNTKTAFKMGYKVTGLSPTALNNAVTQEDYDTANNTLESDNFMVTTDESEL